MRMILATIVMLNTVVPTLIQSVLPVPILESSDVVAAAIGAILTAILGAIGYTIREIWMNAREQRANLAVFRLLYALLNQIKNEAGSDWLASWGMYYRHQLSTELTRFAREKRELIGGDTFFDLIRVSAALRMFSFDREHEDSTIFSVDELIRDLCSTLIRMAPRAIRSKARQKEEIEKLEQERRLMINGVGEFKQIIKPSSSDGASNTRV